MTLLLFFILKALRCSNFMKSVHKVTVCKRLLAEEGLHQGGLFNLTRFICKRGGNPSVCSAASGILQQDTETLLGMFLEEICALQSTLLLARCGFVTAGLMNHFRKLGISRAEGWGVVECDSV